MSSRATPTVAGLDVAIARRRLVVGVSSLTVAGGLYWYYAILRIDYWHFARAT